MTDKVVAFPPPQVDLVDVYLALLDSGAEFEDPRLTELRALRDARSGWRGEMRPYLAAILALLLAGPAVAGGDLAILPDPTLTSGAVRTTDVGDICSTPTSGLRHWSRERDDRILAGYGLPTGPHPTLEIDHLIPLCLAGSDGDANLWAEPRRSIEREWPAELKDDLEHRLCEMVCAGSLDVREAQAEIAEDWVDSYRHRFRSPR
jgi:hypothetical protein